MQYDATTPSEYLSALNDDWRHEKLLQLRDILQKIAPDLKEGIEYKMLNYADAKGSIFHLNAQKHHVGLYVGNASKIDKDGDLLEGLDVEKAASVSKSTVVDESRIGKFVERTLKMRACGADIGC